MSPWQFRFHSPFFRIQVQRHSQCKFLLMISEVSDTQLYGGCWWPIPYLLVNIFIHDTVPHTEHSFAWKCRLLSIVVFQFKVPIKMKLTICYLHVMISNTLLSCYLDKKIDIEGTERKCKFILPKYFYCPQSYYK